MECSPSASNYRGKLLGVVMSLLILQAATTCEPLVTPVVILYCNNKGVISLATCPLMSLPEKQEQADLIRLAKHLSSSSMCKVDWEWVEGHAVEHKRWANCTLPKCLNDAADTLAKDALLAGLNGVVVMEGDVPFKPVRFELSGKRVCGSPYLALESDWGYHEAKALLAEKNILQLDNFDLMWWEGLRRVMNGCRKMYRVWVTKHVLDFSGNNG